MTLLEGPYDDMSSVNKRRIQCMIPEETFEKWFGTNGAFPARGVQDKVLARMFNLLDIYLTECNLCQWMMLNNEEILNEVMNAMSIDDSVYDRLPQNK
jgi:hypothetical protein